jgi:hypothetical protein
VTGDGAYRQTPSAIDGVGEGSGPPTPGLAAEVRRRLDGPGIVVLRRPASRSWMHELAALLGRVWNPEEIFIDPHSERYVRNPRAVVFHTDRYSVDVAAWLVEETDPGGSQHAYLDLRRVWRHLRPEHREALAASRCHDQPDSVGFRRDGGVSRPVVSCERGEPRRFFWIPRRIVAPADPAIAAAVAELRRLTSDPRGPDVVTLTLQRGDLVVVNNQFILHGRDSLPADSRRRLYRLWITSADRLPA